MEKLVTNPKNSSEEKYIRGHLLNHNLGGEGIANNMFPITANANRRHLDSTESVIKGWLASEKKGNPTKWVWYQVTADLIDKRLNRPDKRENFIKSTFNCRAVLKDAGGKEKQNFMTVVYSTPHVKEATADKFEM